MEPQAQSNPSAPAQTASPQPAPAVRYSGLARRIVAAVIDQILVVLVFFIIPAITFFVLGIRSEDISDSYNELVRVFVAIAYITYGTIFEARSGQTLGKRLVKIKVIKVDGQSCDVKSAVIRNVGKIIDGILGIFVLLIIILTPKKQRIGDMLAKTIVVES